MFERFTESARSAVIDAQDIARRLGHQKVGTPHLLLALLPGDTATPLRELGMTAEAVEEQLATVLAGEPRAAEDDAEVLAALGIDIARIREAVEARFGPGALDRAVPGRRRRRGLLALLTGGRLADRDRGGTGSELDLLREPGTGAVRHLPFSPAAKKSLELALREALRLGDRHIGSEHLLLGLIRTSDGAAAVLLDRMNVNIAELRRGIEARHRRSA